MIRARVLKSLIYEGNVYEQMKTFDCKETPFFCLEKRGLVKRDVILDDGEISDVDAEEIIPVDGLPSLEEEQKKIKGKKK